jgi:outer membrane protein assembly factor BamB
VGVLVAGHAALAADYPQFRGPHRDGASAETGLMKQWPAEGPALAWHVSDLGGGYSGPAISGGKLFVISNQGLDNELVLAFDAANGTRLWSTRIGKVGNPNQMPPYPGCRSTPTVVGNRVYVLGSDGDLAALDAAGGKILWAKNVRTEFGGQPGTWAYSESPLVDGDQVVCTPGGADATLLAVNKNNGELLWKSAVPGGDQAGYASIVVAEALGVRQYVQFVQKGVVGVDAKTGKFLWRFDQTAQGSPANIPTPVAFQNTVYSASGRGGGALIRLADANGAFAVEPVYTGRALPNSIGGSVKIGEHLYGTGRTGLICLNFATGEVKWQERGIGTGSVVAADGLLVIHGENGQVAMVEATPEGYREKGRFTPPGTPEHGGSLKAWAYPAVANGKLYIRDLDHLWCYDIAAK